jgi:hypothetical protein
MEAIESTDLVRIDLIVTLNVCAIITIKKSKWREP